jgi:hypothetical protein
MLRTLRGNALLTVTGGLVTPGAHPVTRTHVLAVNHFNY